MMEFKLPVLSRQKTIPHRLRGFEFTSLQDKQFIGKCCFGFVSKANYVIGKECTEVVVKEMLSESSDDIACFVKEANLLCSMSHKNVVSFIGFCPSPFCTLLEYVSFDFTCFGIEKKVSSLLDFLNYLDNMDGVAILGKQIQRLPRILPKDLHICIGRT